jgi:tyrosyl-tRNA synthetase
LSELDEIRQSLAAGSANPRDLKMRLAREIISQFHSAEEAQQAEEAFVRQFVRRELPEDMPTHTLAEPASVIDVMVATKLASSKSEARRLIDGGGVRVDGEKVEGYSTLLAPGSPVVLQVGRRKFVQVK